MGWISGWSHRKTVTITGQSGAGTDYQVNLSIGDASGGDFHLENHCTSFPNDITVTDNDQTTLLDHWVEDLTVDPISLWVEVADDLGSNVDVCIYYDKSGESSASNIGNTSLFGDDFNRTDSSTVGNGWTESEGWGSIDTNQLKILATTEGTSRNEVSKAHGLNSGVVLFESRAKTTATSSSENMFPIRLYGDGTNELSAFQCTYTVSDGESRQMYLNSGGWMDIAGYTPGTWYRYQLIYNFGTNKAEYRIDDVSKASNQTPYTSSTTNLIGLGVIGLNGEAQYWDWIFARKYQAIEPAFSSAGSEESAGGRLVYGGLVNAGLIGGRLA